MSKNKNKKQIPLEITAAVIADKIASTPKLPFLLPPEDEREMFHSDTIDDFELKIIMHDSPYAAPPSPLTIKKIREILTPFAETLPQTFTTAAGRTVNVEVSVEAVRRSHNLTPHLSVLQQRWMIEGCYPQVGFLMPETEFNFSFADALASSMTIWDSLVIGSNSTKIEDFEPRDFATIPELEFGFRIGAAYESGYCFWQSQLEPLRNEVLIRVGAALRGLDPEVEYQKFLASSETYFLHHRY